MNRFGIRLAAGLAVVCLGSLAVFQAQQDKNDQLGDAWPNPADVAASEPPAPLGISSDWPALPDDADNTVIRGNDFPADEAFAMPNSDGGYAMGSTNASQSPAGGAVRLASFEQPADESASQDDASGEQPVNTFAQPAFDPPAIAFPAPLSNPDNTNPDAAESAGNSEFTEPGYAPAFSPPSLGVPTAAGSVETDNSSNYAPDPTAGPASAFNQPAIDDQPSTEMRLSPLRAPSNAAFNTPQDPVPDSSASANVADPNYLSNDETADVVPQDAAPAPAPTAADDPLESAAANWNQPTQQPSLTPLPAATDAQRGTANFDQPTAPIGSGLAQPSATPMQSPSSEFAPLPQARVASNANADSAASRAAQYNLQPAGPTGTAANAMSNYSPGLSQLQTVDKSEILAEPGTRDLEGVQTPSVLVQKRAPAEIRVGKPAQFIIAVKNVGTVPALDVRVFDTVPVGTTLESTLPPAEKVSDLMVWQLGDLQPGDERSIAVNLVPEAEGEIGSVARVTFEAAASVRTMATRPNVEFVHRAPEQVLIGQQIEIDVEIKNTGTGTADNVVILAELPEGLESPNGRSLKLPIGAMPPGATHQDVLRLRATKPGLLTGQFQISDSDGVISDVNMNVQVISPKLEVALEGPSMRYLERQATYKVQIANTGTADAADIDLIVYLDRGLKFVSTEYQGKYDPNRHAVLWALEELRANEVGEVPLTLLPVEAGVQKVRVETTGALGVSARSERELSIETLAELTFSIADDQDPIEPGAFTTYEIRVKNTGSKDDTNVMLEVQIPHPGLELVTAEPSAGTDGRGKVIFDPIARIPAKGEQLYRIRVKGKLADTHVMRATLVSSQSKRPVTKEESTTVYEDR